MLTQALQSLHGIRAAGLGRLAPRARQLQVHLADLGARPGLQLQPKAGWAVRGFGRAPLDLHLRLEITLGLQQLARLGGRSVDQA